MDQEKALRIPPPTTVPAWCVGIPFQTQRPLTDEEKSSLENRISKWSRRRWIVFLLPVGVFLFCCITVVLLPRQTPDWLAVPFWAIAYICLFWGPIRLLGALEDWHLLKKLHADLASGRTDRYQGVVMPGFQTESDVAYFVAKTLFHQNLEKEQLLEVLHESQMVFAVNGVVLPNWLEVKIYRNASASAFKGFSQAVSRTSLSETAPEEVRARPISMEESEELSALAAALYSEGRISAIIGCIYLAMLATSLKLHTFRWKQHSAGLLLATVLGWGVIRYLRNLWLAHQLRRDQKAGRLLLSWNLPGEIQSSTADTPSVEVLGVSGLVWNQRGTPTVWRIRLGNQESRSSPSFGKFLIAILLLGIVAILLMAYFMKQIKG